jgi:hypothetical protein
VQRFSAAFVTACAQYADRRRTNSPKLVEINFRIQSGDKSPHSKIIREEIQMRKQELVKIDDHEIVVKELKVKHVYELIENLSSLNLDSIRTVWIPRVTDLAPEELLEMYPSEIETLYDAFVKVNSSFFRISKKLGLPEVFEAVKRKILSEFSNSSAFLSRPAMPTFGTTDIPSSLKQSPQ